MRLLETALKLIIKIEQGGAYSNIELNNTLRNSKEDNFNGKLLTEMVYGTVRAGETLDWLLSFYISRPLHKVAPKILVILRLCAYQLFFMHSVKPQLLCSDAVDLAKLYGHAGTAKFVNAILRSIERDRSKPIYPSKEDDFVKYIAVSYFFPEWIVKKWQKQFGNEECERLCDFCNRPPQLVVRTNTLLNSRAELMEKMRQAGIGAEAGSLSENAITCPNVTVTNLEQAGFLANGCCYIQDEAAMYAVEELMPQRGALALDVCAAPGGKATYMAELMKNEGKVIAFDIHKHKITLIEENAKRLKVSIVDAILQDATMITDNYYNTADFVLVDAPCSGLGVLRRRPDLRWRKKEEEIARLPFIQKQILENAAKCVKVGGRLVYSTCTTEVSENEQVMEWFLQNNHNFALEKPLIHIMPHTHHTDGFFIAVLKNIKK